MTDGWHSAAQNVPLQIVLTDAHGQACNSKPAAAAHPSEDSACSVRHPCLLRGPCHGSFHGTGHATALLPRCMLGPGSAGLAKTTPATHQLLILKTSSVHHIFLTPAAVVPLQGHFQLGNMRVPKRVCHY